MLKKLFKALRERGTEKAKKKIKKKLKKKLRRFLRKLLLLALLAGSGYMAWTHRKLIVAKLLHKPAPEGDCPRKRIFGKK